MNESIGYTINGLTKHVTTIAPKASLPFTITFAFIEGADTTNNVLESIINFRFKELPIIDLNNEGETYTLENASPGYTPAEYEFIVANYTETDTNTVPMTYSFETTIDSPLQAKIYDSDGNEVTESIDLKGDGATEEHTYTLKIIWDANDTEYEEKDYTCNVKLIAKPTDEQYEEYDEKYEDYEIVKEFNVKIISSCNHTYENGVCTICGAECTHNYAKPEGAGTKFTTTGIYEDGINTAVIPEGFTVSGVGRLCTICGEPEGAIEDSINEGLVIYLIDDKTEEEISAINWEDEVTVLELKQTYDQFVWIPIDNINDMYMCQSEGTDTDGSGTVEDDEYGSCKITLQEVDGGKVAYCTTHSSTLMAGRLKDFSLNDDGTLLADSIYKTFTSSMEPYASDNDGDAENLGFLSSILGTEGYDTLENLNNSLQTEYNEVVKSVYESRGFYVGRYETSNMTETDGTAVNVVAGTTEGISNINWYYMYAQQKDYATNKGLSSTIGSTMIQGAAYDQVMIFVHDAINYDVTSLGAVAHNLSGVYQTGGLNYPSDATVAYKDYSKNIYDLEGNVHVWTLESNESVYKPLRGYTYGDEIIASRYEASRFAMLIAGVPTGETENVGSMSQLYVKCDHEYVDEICTKCGTHTHVYENELCTICGYHPHSYYNWTTKEATCTEEGMKTRTCSICNKIEITKLEATGHSYGDWTVIKEAACTEEGTQTRTCSICNAAVTQTIEATGHSYSNGVCTVCGAIEPIETITADDITNTTDKTLYYGKTVNYTCGDPNIGWRIFYAGATPGGTENNIYLIADSYIAWDDIGTTLQELLYKNDTYYFNFENVISNTVYAGGTSSNRFINSPAKNWLKYARSTDIDNGYGYSNNTNGMISTAMMLDITVWKHYCNSIYSSYAIGGPTLDMFVESWNQTQETQLYYNANAENSGYSISDIAENSYNYVEVTESSITGQLYLIQETSYSFFLASPAANGAILGSMFCVDNSRVGYRSNCLRYMWLPPNNLPIFRR